MWSLLLHLVFLTNFSLTVKPTRTWQNSLLGDIGYSGPCPPGGTHRYYFKVYALDCELPLAAGATKSDVEKAMKDHVLAEGVLVGKYKRK